MVVPWLGHAARSQLLSFERLFVNTSPVHTFLRSFKNSMAQDCQQTTDMAVSQAEIQSVGASKNPKLRAIPDVEIDKHGKFKYILLKVHDPDKEREFKHIVRGMAKAAYHADIFDEITPEIEDTGLDCECVGGGRILHEPGKKKIEIYGYSQGYGQANHSITAHLIGKKFREYDNISWNNDGY